MAYIDFTQIYSTVASVMLFFTGLYTTMFDRRSYVSRNMPREGRWAKYIGAIWMIAGCTLYIAMWVWRTFIW